MNYNEYFNDIKQLLQNKYPQIDFENDFGVNNKLNDLVWVICHRINSPDPIVEETVKTVDNWEDWRKGAGDVDY